MTDPKTADSLMTIDEVLDATRGKYIGFARNLKNFYFSSVATDSRNVVEGSLFVPLYGENQDGHKFVPQAIENGATVVFVSSHSYNRHENRYMRTVAEHGQVVIIVVENTLTALQELAKEYVRKFPELIRVAITGSSGKTTTKEILKSILEQKYSVISNKGNLNSETGLPLTAFTIRSEHELALFEMGMNRENEIGELADCFRPEYALITNIGTAHIGKLGSRDAIVAEKKKVFNYIGKNGVAVIPKDDDYADFLAEGIEGKVVYYGKDVSRNEIEFVSSDGLKGTSFKVSGVSCHLMLPGTYNYNDALGAIALARHLGVEPSEIASGLQNLEKSFGRSEIIEGKFTVMQDCYNANPDSMEKSIEFCSSVELEKGKKIFVLGDMLELGDESEEEHKKIILQAAESDAAFVILVGSEMQNAYEKLASTEKLKENILVYPSYSDDEIKKVIEKINEIGEAGDFVLLKASRSVSLERVGEGIK